MKRRCVPKESEQAKKYLENSKAKRRRFLEKLTERRIYLKTQWHPTKNSHLEPFDSYTDCSRKRAYWICHESKCNHKHEWQASFNARMGGKGCPYCSHRKICPCDSLYAKSPDTTLLWDFERNELGPEHFGTGSSVKVWFSCQESRSKCQHHKWIGTILEVVKYGCPFCRGKKVCPCTSLAKTNPEIAADWNYEKNFTLTPEEVFAGSVRSVWWKCRQHTTCSNHQWKAVIASRVRGGGCPFCAILNGRPCPCYNLATEAEAELLAEWHPKNEQKPADFLPMSHQAVHWRCSRDGAHEWNARIICRSRGGGNCPVCFDYQSYGEKKTREALIKIIGSNMMRHNKSVPKTLPELKDKAPLRFDFLVLPEEGKRTRYCIIEYDGEQHFPSHSLWDEAISTRDRLKNFYATENCLHLLRIGPSAKPYIEKIVCDFIARVQAAATNEIICQLEGYEYNKSYRLYLFPNSYSN